MAVPKKKTSKSRSRRRHSSYVQKQVKKLTNNANIVACKDCGAKKLNHTVCSACGKYNGKQILDMNKEIDKITTLKA